MLGLIHRDKTVLPLEAAQTAAGLMNNLRSAFVDSALASVPFFNRLPDATRTQLSALMQVRQDEAQH